MTKDKVAIITGGARGIGAATVQELLAQGYKVVSADLDEPQAANEDVLFIKIDVSQEASVTNMVEQTLRRFGRIDALVNNAGLLPHNLPLVEAMSLEVWNRFIATNLTGAFLCAKHTLASLRQTKGTIVNIASTRFLQSEGHDAPYAATKGALVAFTHSLAIEAGPEVRVNCISPGWVHTGKEVLRKIDHEQHPAGRVGKPEDIAAMVAFLVSEKALYITGQNFIVDGGMTVKMIYQ
jgi:NAD(P)-dependent dehydrogenase (short-subunit alcohol dehydrogenase family)